MRRAPIIAALGTLAVLANGCGLAPQGQPQAQIPDYRVVRDIQLPGDTSRWDYQTYDPDSHRVYIAHLGASEVVVFDTDTNTVTATVGGVDSVHGLSVAPDIHRLFASATGTNELAVIDTVSLKVIARAPAGDYPDGLAYVPSAGKVYVSDEHGPGDSVFDAKTEQTLKQVQLGGSIGNSQYDPATNLVYVAVGSDNTIAAIDPASDQVVRRYPLKGCDNAHGVQLDVPELHRLFVACDGNSVLVPLDLASKQAGAPLQVGDGPDVLALDPGLHRLYVAAESGELAIFDVSGSRPIRLAQGNAGPNAHTVAVNPVNHSIYLALTDVGGHPVLREMAPVP